MMASSGSSASRAAGFQQGLGAAGLAGLELCNKAHELDGDEGGHGDHGHHAEGVGDDVAAYGDAGTLRQRQQEVAVMGPEATPPASKAMAV